MKTLLFCNNPVVRSSWLSVSAVCALAALPLAGHLSAQTSATEQTTTQLENGGGAKLTDEETQFVKKAGGGNAAEVQLAQVALKNAESADVKEFAQMMIKDHSQANADLALIARNHNIDFPPDVPEKEQALMKKMEGLKGAEFDKAYARNAVEDHTEDLAEYQKAQQAMKDPKLAEYANKGEKLVAHHLEAAKRLNAKLDNG